MRLWERDLAQLDAELQALLDDYIQGPKNHGYAFRRQKDRMQKPLLYRGRGSRLGEIASPELAEKRLNVSDTPLVSIHAIVVGPSLSTVSIGFEPMETIEQFG